MIRQANYSGHKHPTGLDSAVSVRVLMSVSVEVTAVAFESPLKFPLESPLKSPLESPLKPSLKSPLKSPLESLSKSLLKSLLEFPLKFLLQSPLESPLEFPLKSPLKSPLEFPLKLQAAVVPQEKLSQEVGVYPDQLVQAGEHGMNGAQVHLELIQHALPENPFHDVQRSHVVQLFSDKSFEVWIKQCEEMMGEQTQISSGDMLSATMKLASGENYNLDLHLLHSIIPQQSNFKILTTKLDWAAFGVMTLPSIGIPLLLWYSSKRKYDSPKAKKTEKT
ncbi:hypothetical protein F7725_025664 [Dissostichus mawsoni]|uniref:Uncharacterized protein n=1 Tax=Dissostichus mawsoni TaxID=36200 RepID=A0A7J5XBU3_DISMA|nr:hypothetical protein F7725_025664 [Dissostichus mawsoni]